MTTRANITLLVLTPLFWLTGLLSPFALQAEEGCYVSLSFKTGETNGAPLGRKAAALRPTPSKAVLIRVTNLKGRYQGITARSHPSPFKEDELVKIYTRGRRRLGKYAFRPAGPLMIDSFDPQMGPGRQAVPEAQSTLVLPYDRRIQKIEFMRRPGKEIRLNRRYLSCQGCIGAEKQGTSMAGDFCCSGLTPIAQGNRTFVCAACGDGKCAAPENHYNCRKDCRPPAFFCREGTKKVGDRCE